MHNASLTRPYRLKSYAIRIVPRTCAGRSSKTCFFPGHWVQPRISVPGLCATSTVYCNPLAPLATTWPPADGHTLWLPSLFSGRDNVRGAHTSSTTSKRMHFATKVTLAPSFRLLPSRLFIPGPNHVDLLYPASLSPFGQLH
jgi:hypothetical protein